MIATKLEPVRCACGWRGVLASRTPCPACAEPYTSRLTDERITMLRAVGAQQPGQRPVHIQPMMRIWLVEHGLIAAAGPKRPTSDHGRCPPPRLHRLTERGQIAIEEDDAVAEAMRRRLVAAPAATTTDHQFARCS